jgi:hypothetical protein
MYGYYSPEGPNQSKSHILCSPKINLIDLRFLKFLSKYLTMRHRQYAYEL